MALTLNDVARNLRYDEGFDENDLQELLDTAEQAVKDHVKTNFDAENKVQQRAILLLCGYYDNYRNIEKEMPSNGSFLPEPVLALLNPYYTPLAM
ncbi:head-tail connector protein [uncultured Acinetobacter sp.]|uniref:head-tail connector protein n=1 Tax=uncultured Acinetobacter sp. TaxID=165433 RepID=UPI0037499DC8